MRSSTAHRAWRAYRPAERRLIETQHEKAERAAHCPCCGGVLEARPGTRMAAIVKGIRGFDLECRACRRFLARIMHTPHSAYISRIRRLAAAVMRA
jgi:hypothetical protein